LPLDLIIDSIIVCDFAWKLYSWNEYCTERNYEVIFDVSLILLIVAYSIVEIRYRHSYEGVDDLQASLVITRFGTRVVYSCRNLCKACFKKSHARIATEESETHFAITAPRQEGRVWDVLKGAEGRICRALGIENAMVLERTSRHFSIEHLLEASMCTTHRSPCILWLRSGPRVIGFYRECPWQGSVRTVAPKLRIVEVVNDQYELLPAPKISFVNREESSLVITTDAGTYAFEEGFKTMKEHLVGQDLLSSTVDDLELISYSKNSVLHLATV
jgi:hypothetical protein